VTVTKVRPWTPLLPAVPEERGGWWSHRWKDNNVGDGTARDPTEGQSVHVYLIERGR